MAYAPASTNSPFAATGGTAFCRALPSQPAPIRAHQKYRAGIASRGISRGHLAHVVSNQPKEGSPFLVPFWSVVDASDDPMHLAGLKHARLLSRNSHRLGISLASRRLMAESSSLPIGQNLPVRASKRCARSFYSAGIRGSRPAAAQSFPDQHRSQFGAAGVIHNRNRLSKFVSNAGFKPSEATNGCVPKHRRAFHENEGELPNVSF